MIMFGNCCVAVRMFERCIVADLHLHFTKIMLAVTVFMSPLRRHIFVCFMAKWAFLGGFQP